MIKLLGVFLLLFALNSNAARVKTGSQVLAESGFKILRHKRVGLITNPSGVDANLNSSIDILRAAPGVQLAALFGPEHGIYGDVPAGDKVESGTDQRTGLPVNSLYGATHRPTREMLQGLDVMVYDLQDTGCRSYTFISTLGAAMDACGEAGVEFVVLDRPDPLGGDRVEGPMVHQGFRSFVSRWNVPYVYGMTCGELARMINGEGWITNRCKLRVVPMKGWKRSMVWEDTGLPWVLPSPHVPHGSSPLYQVATGMLGEIGGVSTGIGYTLPFECVAAPGLDAHAMADALNSYGLPGVRFRPITYKPFYFTFEGQEVGGAQIYFTDPAHAPLTAINFYALQALRDIAKRDLFQEGAATNKSFSMFDKVNGTDASRKAFESGASAASIVASWQPGEKAFRKLRKKYLLY
ncbi:MAG TPA: DUF1343 domain-containing protein [Verrucomicrobiae bacterium]|nr:DUF1343 domain-containing protein [Verrucomicrobiae bacterium]